ncbi:MAG TPA: hypothetical protein VMF31_14080 [Solirubrobacterales bacterium]|nr:hypothetical protein [Solirubrobacterales bacterium]
MSLASFYFGIAQLVLLTAALGYFAFRVRGRILPSFDGSLARLAELIIAIGSLIVFSELLGLFGLFHGATLLIGALLAAALAWARIQPGRVEADLRPPLPPISTGAWILTFAIAGVLAAQWAAFASYSLDHGITNFDSVWYHMPFAADIYQTGSSLSFHHTETVFLNWFYPQNSEMVHAAGMALTDRDFVSIFLNMGWLGIALLAGWCVGRPYGRPHLSMVAIAVLLTTHTLVAREPGTGKNDIVAIALTLAAIAVLINRGAAPRDGRGRISPDWTMAVAGLAAGLAAGTKVTALAPVAMITFAALFATVGGRRFKAAAVWFGSALVGGGFWYLRSFIASGNPLPQMESIGPIDLPGPERLQVGRPDFNVLHYIADSHIWRDYFIPGLEKGFGDLWPLLIAVAIVGLVAIMFRGPGRLTRSHGAAALVAICFYLITPLSAAGPEGHPTAFAINLRFLIPALAMATVVVPLLPWFDRARPRLIFAAVLVALFLVSGRSDAIYDQPGRAFGVAFALAVVGLPALAWLLRDRIRARFGIGSALAPVVAVVAAGSLIVAWPLASYYFDSRYENFEPETGLAAAYRWADGTSDTSIGLAGSTAGFKQYGFYGEDLSNEVTYIGREVGGGGFEAIGRCREFRQAVNDAGVEYLVTSPFLNFDDTERPIRSPERSWIESDPALSRVTGPAQIEVWSVRGRLDPDGCRVAPEDEFVPGLKSGAAVGQ